MLIADLCRRSRSSILFVGPDGGRSEHGASSLLRKQITPTRVGERIAVRRDSDRSYLHALVDAAMSGSIVVSVNTRFSDSEAAELVERSGAVVGAAPFADPAVDDPYVVFTTSGTTAKPKMVLHTQRSIATHARQVAARFGYDEHSVVMVALPLCGTFGLTSLFAAMAGGANVVLVERFDADLLAGLIPALGVTAMNGTDDMFHRLLLAGADLSSLQVGGYAAFNSSLADIVERASAAGGVLTGLYGMSEVQALFSLRDPTLDVRQRSQAGGTITSPDGEARVVDPHTGEHLDVGIEGELQLRGPSMMAGYLAEGGAAIDRALTADAVADDGWFTTGDVGVIEGEDSFRFVTRLGDALRIGGFLVSPNEIEQVLLEVEGITAAQVIAHDRPDGARPVAFVTGDRLVANERALIDHCTRHLARFKCPVAVIQVDQFPVTESANGTKTRKAELRRMALRHLGGGSSTFDERKSREFSPPAS